MDVAGNIESTQTIWIAIDKTAPTTTHDAPNDWQNTDVNVHLTCSDGTGSGCSLTQYRIDNGPWQTYDTNILFSTDGNHQLDFNSKDAVGNIESTNTIYVLVDKNKPTITLLNYTEDGTTSSSYPSFEAQPIDSPSGPDYCLVDVYKNGALVDTNVVVSYLNEKCTYSISPKLESGDYVKVTWRAVDLAGNVSEDVNSGQITYLATGQIGGTGGSSSIITPILGQLGDPCEVDADCESPLVCSPDTNTCQYEVTSVEALIDYAPNTKVVGFIPNIGFNYSIIVVNKTDRELAIETSLSDELKPFLKLTKEVDSLIPGQADVIKWNGVVRDSNIEEITGTVYIIVDKKATARIPLTLRIGHAPLLDLLHKQVYLKCPFPFIPGGVIPITVGGLAILGILTYLLFKVFTTPVPKPRWAGE